MYKATSRTNRERRRSNLGQMYVVTCRNGKCHKEIRWPGTGAYDTPFAALERAEYLNILNIPCKPHEVTVVNIVRLRSYSKTFKK